MTYAVKEIFYTLQGEGAHAGRPAVFLRFAGCNLWTGLERDRDKGPAGVRAGVILTLWVARSFAPRLICLPLSLRTGPMPQCRRLLFVRAVSLCCSSMRPW